LLNCVEGIVRPAINGQRELPHRAGVALNNQDNYDQFLQELKTGITDINCQRNDLQIALSKTRKGHQEIYELITNPDDLRKPKYEYWQRTINEIKNAHFSATDRSEPDMDVTPDVIANRERRLL
jgi:hypothetical protein